MKKIILALAVVSLMATTATLAKGQGGGQGTMQGGTSMQKSQYQKQYSHQYQNRHVNKYGKATKKAYEYQNKNGVNAAQSSVGTSNQVSAFLV